MLARRPQVIQNNRRRQLALEPQTKGSPQSGRSPACDDRSASPCWEARWTLLGDQKDRKLHAGDALLVQSAWDNLLHPGAPTDDWVVVGRPADHAHAGRLGEKRSLVITVLVLMLAAMALNLVPAVVAVVLAAVALVLGGCAVVRENWTGV